MSEQRYKNRTYRMWAEEEILWLRNMHQAGMSTRDIAYTLKRSASSVHTQVSRMKIDMSAPINDTDISAKDLSIMMSIHRQHLEQYILKGLKSYKRGKNRYFTIDHIKEWLINGMAEVQWNRRDVLDLRFMQLVDECRQKTSKWLVNRKQVVSALGIVNQTVSNWMRNKDFPKPSIVHYPNKQIWKKSDVELWSWKNGKTINWEVGD